MKVIIVDDESFAIEALEYVLEDMEGVEVAGAFQNASEALDFVRDHKVDLPFWTLRCRALRASSWPAT